MRDVTILRQPKPLATSYELVCGNLSIRFSVCLRAGVKDKLSCFQRLLGDWRTRRLFSRALGWRAAAEARGKQLLLSQANG